MNFFESKSKLIVLCGIFLIIALCSLGVILKRSKSQSDVVWINEHKTQSSYGETDNSSAGTGSKSGKSETKDTDNKVKVVHVDGAVKRPGVYKFKGDKRVYDALDKAGGTLDFADKSKLNLAEPLKDGDRITVPRVKFPVNNQNSSTYEKTVVANPSKKITYGTININTASRNDLEKIPHIGRVTAEKIIAHRTRYGRFASPEDLLNIDGIGESKLEKIRPYIEL